jgi:hypothetical protein
MGPGFPASSGVLPCHYDFIYAQYLSASAALICNVVNENALMALAHHSIVDQAAVIKHCSKLITVYLTQKLNVTFLLPDKKLCVSVSLKLLIIYCG